MYDRTRTINLGRANWSQPQEWRVEFGNPCRLSVEAPIEQAHLLRTRSTFGADNDTARARLESGISLPSLSSLCSQHQGPSSGTHRRRPPAGGRGSESRDAEVIKYVHN